MNKIFILWNFQIIFISNKFNYYLYRIIIYKYIYYIIKIIYIKNKKK